MSLATIIKNIDSIFEKRKLAVYALCLRYARLAIEDFRKEQGSNKYWVNRTDVAKDTMFTDAFMEDNVIGWFMAHLVEYGPYLELANDAKHQAIKPTIEKFIKPFKQDLEKIYA